MKIHEIRVLKPVLGSLQLFGGLHIKDLKSLLKLELIAATDRAVDIEKDAIQNTTRHFEEIFRRKEYLPNYPSMFEMLTKRWGYCAGSAQMRLDTIRLTWAIPEAKEKLEAGEISMSVAAKLQTFLRSEKKAERDLNKIEKSELLTACLGKTKFEAEKVFAKISPELEKRDVVRPVSESKVRMNLSVANETYEKLNELRDILSHVDSSMSLGDLIDRLADDGLQKYSPKRKAERAKVRRDKRVDARAKAVTAAEKDATSVRSENVNEVAAKPEVGGLASDEKPVRPANSFRPVKQTRYVPAQERHQVADDGLGCTYVNRTSGKRCGSKKFLQLDHVHEFAKGGANTADNLRWMCGAHNRWRYESPLRLQTQEHVNAQPLEI